MKRDAAAAGAEIERIAYRGKDAGLSEARAGLGEIKIEQRQPVAGAKVGETKPRFHELGQLEADGAVGFDTPRE